MSTKVFYGLGSIAFGVKDNGFQTILLLFYNQVMHVPAFLAGGAVMIALLCDAFIDPVVGQFSDNLRTRWGRRHPLMYASALPVAISYLLLWNPPHWSPMALFFYLVVVAIVVRTFITFYEIPSSALAPELSENYDQRTSFLSYRVFFGWYGGLFMLELAYLVFLTPDAHHPVGQLNEAGYGRYGVTAAIVMFFAILISAAGTHRFIPYFRAPQYARKSIFQYAREMYASLSNKSFLILMLAAIPFNLATGLLFALGIYLNTYFWDLSNKQIFVLTLATFIAVFLAFLIAVPFSRRWGKRDSAIVMFALGLVISVIPLGLRLLGLFFANGSPLLLPTLFAFQAFTGALMIGSSIIMLSMLADVVEDDELKTGRRSEGLFFAGGSFLQKTVSGAGLFLSGIVLSVVHFPDHAMPGHIDPTILRNLALVFLPCLVVLYGSAIAVISLYPIKRKDHEENVRRLAAEAALIEAPIGTEEAVTPAPTPAAPD
ncbi:MAG TPA: MFS transporter [Rhizomicrobium sp.]|nr:MFS transporter [Rhizomicrobium sp.]